MSNPPAREGDEAVSKAADEWLRNYYGSIDTTALLLAFKAGAATCPYVKQSGVTAHCALAESDVPAAEERGAAREREECAKVAEERYADSGWHEYYQTAGAYIATAIRARAALRVKESEG